MRKAAYLFVFLVPFALATASARAQQSKVYLGAGGGSSSISLNSSDFNLGIPQETDKASTGFKVFAGIRFNQYLAGEIGYVDLGKFKIKYNGGGAGTAELDYQVSGFAVSGLGTLPLTQDFSLFGRVGLFASTAKLTLANATGALAANLAAAGITAGSSDTADATTLLYGAGVQYDFTKNLSGRIEYENFGEVGDQNDTGRATVSLISASLLYRF
jgi:OOP family OmpA-OmpF porin